MAKPFLSANWKNLLMINYEVDASLLAPHVPEHCELDLFQGQALVSLVAFQFLNTRVMGFRIPWHVNFPEINLRFYLRRIADGEVRRGVAFLSEIVPRRAISLVANTLYNEHYKTRKMSQRVRVSDDVIRAEYTFIERGKMQRITSEAGIQARELKSGSLEDFITEHYYGYTKGRRTVEYRVEHPAWRTYPLQKFRADVDFAAAYGDKWGFLTGRQPHSALFAEGSEVKVYPAGKLKRHG
jgi:uncharacterized protein